MRSLVKPVCPYGDNMIVDRKLVLKIHKLISNQFLFLLYESVYNFIVLKENVLIYVTIKKNLCIDFRLFYKWMQGTDRPASGSLVQFVTKDNKTELVIA